MFLSQTVKQLTGVAEKVILVSTWSVPPGHFDDVEQCAGPIIVWLSRFPVSERCVTLVWPSPAISEQTHPKIRPVSTDNFLDSLVLGPAPRPGQFLTVLVTVVFGLLPAQFGKNDLVGAVIWSDIYAWHWQQRRRTWGHECSRSYDCYKSECIFLTSALLMDPVLTWQDPKVMPFDLTWEKIWLFNFFLSSFENQRNKVTHQSDKQRGEFQHRIHRAICRHPSGLHSYLKKSAKWPS